MALISCQSGVSNTFETEAEKKARLDSFSMKQYGKTSEEVVKDRVNKSLGDALMDTVGLYKSPVLVTKATLFKGEYSSYRDIRLTYKNVSNKSISAIKFRWKGVDAFGEPADMGSGSMVEGFGGGFMDNTLKSGRATTSEWGILSRNGKKVILAWATDVAFSDGTKWKVGK